MIDIKEYFGFLKKRKFKDIFATGNFDMTFLILVIFLTFFGLVMVYSSSYMLALNDPEVGNDPYHYIKKQVMVVLAGIAVVYIVSRINPLFMKEFAVLALIVSFILLVVVLFYHVDMGPGRGEIKRSIQVPFIGQFQPSEFAKLTLVMFCAWGMNRKQNEIAKQPKELRIYIIVTFFMFILIFAESHLSGAILIFCIGSVMLLLSGVKLKWVLVPSLIIMVLGILGMVALWLIINKPEEARKFLPDRIVEIATPSENMHYMLKRVVGWMDKGFDPQDARWQINNSLYAVASGGFFGRGLGESIQKHMFLSEANNDFVFAVICEELGFVGAITVMTLFGLLVWRGFVIAIKAKDRFSSLLVLGIVFQIGLQAALHIAVVTDTVPNTGISLPFFSTGGSALLILFIEIGMILAVSRGAKMRKS